MISDSITPEQLNEALVEMFKRPEPPYNITDAVTKSSELVRHISLEMQSEPFSGLQFMFLMGFVCADMLHSNCSVPPTQ